MKARTATTATTYALLCLAGGVSFIMPNSLSVPLAKAAAEEDVVILRGILRDFKQAHSDMEVMPTDGPGHYAGSIAEYLPGNQRPQFLGAGFKVDTQWLDNAGRKIAPSLENVQVGVGRGEGLGFRVDEKFEIKKEAVIDAFDSNFGPYGLLGNFGALGYISLNTTQKDKMKVDKKSYVKSDVDVGPDGNPGEVIKNEGVIAGSLGNLESIYVMPDLIVPDDLEPWVDEYEITGTETFVGDTNPDDDNTPPALYFGELSLKKNSILYIEGDLQILCTEKFKMDEATIILRPDAKLSVYLDDRPGTKDVEIKKKSLVNANSETDRVSFNVIGDHKVKIDDESHVYATVFAPAGKLEVKDKAQFYGGFVGREVKVEDKGSGIHIDLANSDIRPKNFALTVRDKIEIEDNNATDAFDSNEGAYGGTNKGITGLMSTNSTKDDKIKLDKVDFKGTVLVGPGGDPDDVIKLEGGATIDGSIGELTEPIAIPVVTPPPLGASVGELKFPSNSTTTLSASVRCKKLKLEDRAIVEISGHLVIRVDDKIEMKKKSEIRILPDSSLTLFVEKEIKIEEQAMINMNTGNPQLVSILRTSVGKKGKIEIKKNAGVAAWIQGGKTELTVKEGAEFHGSFIGEKVKIEKGGKFFIDMAYLTLPCTEVNDVAGVAGAPSTGGILSSTSFKQWFTDVEGLNLSKAQTITLNKSGGVYELLDDSFYPIDDELLGNEGQPHNYYFTYAIKADFVYQDCGGQFMEFQGGDGTWVFINDQLVLDLNGVATGQEQYIEVDRLGLEPGETYALQFFHAQRSSSQSIFRMRTNLFLNTDNYVPTTTAQYD